MTGAERRVVLRLIDAGARHRLDGRRVLPLSPRPHARRMSSGSLVVPDVRGHPRARGTSSAEGGRVTARELVERLQFRERLAAIVDGRAMLGDKLAAAFNS
jgi:hypothetical protein